MRLSVSVALALLSAWSARALVPIPREVFEYSGYTADQLSELLQLDVAAPSADCPQPNTTTKGVIKGPEIPTAKEILKRNSFVKRKGTKLTLLDEPFTFVGPNIYWLGLDENVIPNPSYPAKSRVLEAMAVVKAMKGTTIRGHTLGISVGTPLSLEPSLNVWNEDAFESIDFAILAARIYGLKLMIPLTDNYNWYHGGKYQFIGWHGIPWSGTGADILPDDVGRYFYNTTEIVDSFKTYVTKLLTHVNQYTGIAIKDDPTIALWETGNELAWGRWNDGPAPPAWTREIAALVKGLSPHPLFGDGTYGIYQGSGQVDVKEVDIFTDHFYGPNITKMTIGIDAVHAVDRAYLIGEYDWTEQEGDDDLDSWLSSAQKQGAIGHFYWSLFGKADNCCDYVTRLNDPYALFYLRDEKAVEGGGKLTKWAAKFQGSEAPKTPPAVACPQKVPGVQQLLG